MLALPSFKRIYGSLCETITVWTYIWHTYSDEHTFYVDHVCSALYQLQFPCFDSLSPMLDPEMILVLMSLRVWCSHWLFVFNGIPFMVSQVTQSIRRLISVYIQENFVNQR